CKLYRCPFTHAKYFHAEACVISAIRCPKEGTRVERYRGCAYFIKLRDAEHPEQRFTGWNSANAIRGTADGYSQPKVINFFKA
ncbi:hypothetical protein, partial [Tardiphaga sp. P5_C10]